MQFDPHKNKAALIVVDMQRYYLEAEACFYRYHQAAHPGSMDYISQRSKETVIPNIGRLLTAFRSRQQPIGFLRLCGLADDRSDLHWLFRESHLEALERGFTDLYPLQSDPFSEVVDSLRPRAGEAQIFKTTFSGFTHSSHLQDWLETVGAQTLVMTGLATSQCVETTARDGSDRGLGVIQIEDAQADYDEIRHRASLFSSRGVCAGLIYDTQTYLSRVFGSAS